jgi:hypothetical protein
MKIVHYGFCVLTFSTKYLLGQILFQPYLPMWGKHNVTDLLTDSTKKDSGIPDLVKYI